MSARRNRHTISGCSILLLALPAMFAVLAAPVASAQQDSARLPIFLSPSGGPWRVAEISIDSLTISLVRGSGGKTILVASTNLGVFELPSIDSASIAGWAGMATRLAPPMRYPARTGFPDSVTYGTATLKATAPLVGDMRFARLTDGAQPDFQFAASNGTWAHTTRLNFDQAIQILTFLYEGPADSTAWRVARLGYSGKVFGFSFDKPAVPRPNNPLPRYPASLRQAGIEGAVKILVVVDTSGRAVMNTIKLISSSNNLFAAAAVEVLPRLRFYPAERDGVKVSMIVQLPFVFKLTR